MQLVKSNETKPIYKQTLEDWSRNHAEIAW